MFRMWGKLVSNNHLLKDYVVEDSSDRNRTAKVYSALEEISREFDLAVPIWLEKNIRDFKRVAKTRFTADSFVEQIDFDYLEIQVIEEDYRW